MTPRERPRILPGKSYCFETGCGKLYITINGDKEGSPTEVMARMGKTGGCVASQIEGIGRLCSAALQHEVEPKYIIKQLKGIRCPSEHPNIKDGIKVKSCSDAFAKALEEFLNTSIEEDEPNKCPRCKTELKKVKNNLVCECGFERAD